MIDPELLSRFVDGDVTPDEAAAVEAAIAADPAVARQVDALRSVVDGLRGLHDPEPPVRLLAATPAPARGWSLLVSGGVGALAAAAAWLLAPVPTLVLTPGEHRLVGRVDAEVGDVSVDVNGDVALAWEPEAPVVRVNTPEVDMDRGHVGAAVVGGLLTVGVLGGSATVCGGDGVEVVVPAGASRTVPVGAVARSGASDAAPASPSAPGSADARDPAATIVRLQQQVASLQAELDDARRQAGLARGQLNLEQGTPIAWPSSLDVDLSPARFEATVLALVKQRGDLAVETVDCAEYPCVAVLRPTSVEGDWPERYRGLGEALSTGVDHANASMSVSRMQDDDGAERGYVAVWVSDQDAPVDGAEVDRRAGWRARALVEGVAE